MLRGLVSIRNIMAQFIVANPEIPLSLIAYCRTKLTGREAEVCLNLVDSLDEHDDVANVYADFDISEEDLAKLSG